MPFIGALMGVFLLAGTAGLPAAASAPAEGDPPLSLPTYTLTLTGYNAVPGQTDDTPFITASGAYTNPETVAARSQDLGKEMPFGTIIAIEGPAEKSGTCGYGAVGDTIGYRIVADTMNARYTDRIDVVFHTNDRYLLRDGRTVNAARLLGVCKGITVKVVGFVDIKNPANLPETQAKLAALVEGGKLALK